MKFFVGLMGALLASPAIAAERVATRAATGFAIPIPLSTGWVEGFLLLIVWLFIVAIVVGPLVGFFRLEPRSSQVFSDDKKQR